MPSISALKALGLGLTAEATSLRPTSWRAASSLVDRLDLTAEATSLRLPSGVATKSFRDWASA